MTDEEHWASDDPEVLAAFGQWETPNARGRLVVACGRRVQSHFSEQLMTDAFDAMELHLDGRATRHELDYRREELEQPRNDEFGKGLDAGYGDATRLGLVEEWSASSAARAYDEIADYDAVLVALGFFGGGCEGGLPLDYFVYVAARAAAPLVFPAENDPTPAREQAMAAERRAQVALIRDIIRPPFLRRPFAPAWRTETAKALAAGIDADAAFDRLPVLADALEDAGCDEAELLAHLRSPGPHARGCWALETVLGRR